ncbi:MAG: nuclear transport factor 2 family protein [Promethearchaeota archaeon]
MDLTECHEFCTRWLHAWTTKNVAELLSCYTPDCYYQDPAKPTGIRGTKDLNFYFQKLFSATPDWKWEEEELYPTPKGFVFKWKATFFKKPQLLVEYGMDIVELTQGKISRNEVYFDRSRVFPNPTQNQQSRKIKSEKSPKKGKEGDPLSPLIDPALSPEDMFRVIGDSLFPAQPLSSSHPASPSLSTQHSENVSLVIQYRQELDRLRALLQKNALSPQEVTIIQTSIAEIEGKIRALLVSQK